MYAAICHRWGPRNARIRQQCFDVSMLGFGALDDALQADDTLISQATFVRRTRRKTDLHRIALLYLDIDFRNADFFGRPRRGSVCAQWAVTAVLAHLDARQLPRPSYMLFSGRGLHAKWLHDCLPAAALPRWQACMKHLCSELQAHGADPNAKDCSRVLRPVGSVNTKSGESVREVWRNQNAAGGIRVYRFDELATAILPLSREECHQRQAIKKAKKAAGKRKRGSKAAESTAAATSQATSPSRRLWELRLRDIELLFELRAYDRCNVGIPDGMRVTAMLVIAVALSHLVRPGDILSRLAEYRDRWVRHWTPDKLRQSVATVLRLAPEGKRLRYKNASLRELLRITPNERSKLRSIGLDDDQRRELKRNKAIAKRRAEGARPLDELMLDRSLRDDAVRARRDAGHTWKDVCAALGISRAAANRAYERSATRWSRDPPRCEAKGSGSK